LNREQKSAVIEEVAAQIEQADAILAVDYRGLTVKEAADLRNALHEAGATFRVVKNRLTQRAADQAGAESLKAFLTGPTAFTFVNGDVALAAKALARFRRETESLEFKGGQMNGDPLTVDQMESIARLPAREQLNAQFVGVLASPITTLVRGLASMISGLASQLKQIEEQGLVGGGAAETAPPAEAEAEAPAEAEAEAPAEAPGDPVAEGEAAAEASEETATETETPSEGGDSEEKEG
jgi:large subunit ribosomal protein L10